MKFGTGRVCRDSTCTGVGPVLESWCTCVSCIHIPGTYGVCKYGVYTYVRCICIWCVHICV